MEKFSFHLGNVEVTAHNINELREYVEEIRNLAGENGSDLSKYLSDFCFDVELRYQQFHNLDADNWDMVHNEDRTNG